jgi:hypothetical protein
MPIVFNIQTQLPEVVQDTTNLDPKVFQPLKDQQIGMVSTDGKYTNVPGSGLEGAIKNGWRLAEEHETGHEEHIKEIVDQREKLGGAIAEPMLNTFLGGAPHILASKYANPDSVEANERMAEENPIQHQVGNVAGFVGSLAAGGEIGAAGDAVEQGVLGTAEKLSIQQGAQQAAEQAAKVSLGRKLGAAAAKGAVEGALWTAPTAAAQISIGDPESAAESLMWGIGTGGILGGSIKGAGELYSGAKGMATEAASDWLTKPRENGLDFGTELRLKDSGFSAQDLNKMASKKGRNVGNEMADFLDSENIRKLSAEDADRIHNDAGEQLGAIRKSADKIANDAKADINISEQPAPFSTTNAVKILDDKISALTKYSGIDTPLFKEQKAALDELRDHIANHTINPETAFQDANILQRQLDGISNYDATKSSDVNNIRKLSAQSVRQEDERAFKDLYDKVPGNAEDNAEYLKQKNRYGMSYDLKKYGNKQFQSGDFGNIPFLSQTNSLNHNIKAGYLTAAAHTILPTPLAIPAGFVAEHYLDKAMKGGLMSDVGSYLRKMSKDPGALPLIGSLMAKTANEAAEKATQSIPQLMLNSAPYRTAAALNPFKTYLGDRSNGLSTDQQYNKVAKEITEVQANPQMIVDNVNHLTSMFPHDPSFQQLLAQKQYGVIQYLYANLPKNPNAPQPFSNNKWEPTKLQKQDFADKLAIINNPMSAFHFIDDGSLNKNHIEALKTNYPSIYSEMVKQVQSGSYGPDSHKVSAQRQNQYSKLLGIPLTDTQKNLSHAQNVYASPPPQQQQSQQGKPAKKPRKETLKNVPSLQTNTQRLEYGTQK